VSGFSSRRPGHNRRCLQVRFFLDDLTLEQDFLRVLRFPVLSSFHHCSILIYHCPHEVCDSPDQATHYHTLDSKLGSSCLTRHLSELGVEVIWHMMIIALMMEAVSTSETLVNFYQTTWRNIPEDSHLVLEFNFGSFQLIPCSGALHDKLIICQLVSKFPTFYGTR
jgi:hypothetical protein